jgi:hypothetical protein
VGVTEYVGVEVVDGVGVTDGVGDGLQDKSEPGGESRFEVRPVPSAPFAPAPQHRTPPLLLMTTHV